VDWNRIARRLWLLACLGAIGCGSREAPAPAAPRCQPACAAGERCGADGRCLPPSAAIPDASLSENRVPDAGITAPSTPRYRVSGALGALPGAAGPGYQLHDQRLDLLQPSCARVADRTLCESGSLH
jgi:hypothetical protein